jgi:hypothetical protein
LNKSGKPHGRGFFMDFDREKEDRFFGVYAGDFYDGQR